MKEKVSKLKVGDVLNFKAEKIDGSDFELNSLKTKKIISFFPKLNTSICDFQTLKMLDWAKKYPQIKIISLSLDSIEIAQKWCQAHGVDNLDFVSDKKYLEFANQTDLFLVLDNGEKLLWRGLIFLDENNKVLELVFNKTTIKEDPDYKTFEKSLEKYIP